MNYSGIHKNSGRYNINTINKAKYKAIFII